MSVKIFVSHKQEDSKKAESIARYIKNQYGFDTYVDTLDDGIVTHENITDRIIGKLRDTTHLLVVLQIEALF